MTASTPQAPGRSSSTALVVLLIAFAGVVIAKESGQIDGVMAKRGVGALLGLMMVVTGNFLPKLIFPLTRSARVGAAERLCGWILVLTGLTLVGLRRAAGRGRRLPGRPDRPGRFCRGRPDLDRVGLVGTAGRDRRPGRTRRRQSRRLPQRQGPGERDLHPACRRLGPGHVRRRCALDRIRRRSIRRCPLHQEGAAPEYMLKTTQRIIATNTTNTNHDAFGIGFFQRSIVAPNSMPRAAGKGRIPLTAGHHVAGPPESPEMDTPSPPGEGLVQA
mgnify:CR=1 FL=1